MLHKKQSSDSDYLKLFFLQGATISPVRRSMHSDYNTMGENEFYMKADFQLQAFPHSK